MDNARNCGAMLERIQIEHHRLNEALVDIRHQIEKWDSLPPQPMPAALQQRLRALAGEIRAHFQEEEEGGCLEEAVVRCPSASPQVKAIEAEHRELLPMLDGLLAIAGDPKPASRLFREKFEVFARKLHDHEAAENRLFQYCFGGVAADYDIEGNY